MTLLVAALLMGSVLLVSFYKEVPIGVLTSDPIAIAKLPAYTGFLSQIGIFLWSACATTCWICARILARRSDLAGLRRFLLASGWYALFLGIDDVFLLHEEVFPSLGLHKYAVVGGYAAMALLYFVGFRAAILRTNYALLGIAFACLGISAVLDSFPVPGLDRYFFEDGAKLTGILSWLAYLADTGSSAVGHSATPTGNRAQAALGD